MYMQTAQNGFCMSQKYSYMSSVFLCTVQSVQQRNWQQEDVLIQPTIIRSDPCTAVSRFKSFSKPPLDKHLCKMEKEMIKLKRKRPRNVKHYTSSVIDAETKKSSSQPARRERSRQSLAPCFKNLSSVYALTIYKEVYSLPDLSKVKKTNNVNRKSMIWLPTHTHSKYSSRIWKNSSWTLTNEYRIKPYEAHKDDSMYSFIKDSSIFISKQHLIQYQSTVKFQFPNKQKPVASEPCDLLHIISRRSGSKEYLNDTSFISNIKTHSRMYEREPQRAERTLISKKDRIPGNQKNPCPKYKVNPVLYDRTGKNIKFRNDVQLFYVFEKPWSRTPIPKVPLKNVEYPEDAGKNVGGVIKRLYQKLSESNEGSRTLKNVPQVAQCGNTSMPCQAGVVKQQGSFFRKRVSTGKLNQISHMNASKSAEAKTHSGRYGRKNYGRKKRNVSLMEPNEYSENLPQLTQKCANSSTICKLKGEKNKEASLKRLFKLLVEPNEGACRCLANKLKQTVPFLNKPECTCTEAETQARRYGGRVQRAGRESFYRDTGTSGVPKCTNYTVNPDLQDMPEEEIQYKYDNTYVDDKPATMNRRVGSNGGYNVKCCSNMPQDAQKYINSSAFCQLDDIRNQGSFFKRFCHIMLESKTVPQMKQKCVCNTAVLCQLDGVHNEFDFFENMVQYTPKHANLSTLCRIDCVKNNNGGIFKNVLHSLLDSTLTQRRCKSRGTLCQGEGMNNEQSTLKKLCQLLLEPNEPKITNKTDLKKLRKRNPLVSIFTFTEATTQSRKYGGRQERAGKEEFRKNKGTSGAPKYKRKKENNKEPKEQEYDVVEEVPLEPVDYEPPAITNKAVGIGTNCNLTFGWFKDRHAYGEPKPRYAIKDIKTGIEECNKTPIRHTLVNTKIGASLKADSVIKYFNTNAATQSRKYRKRDLRAGREKFYRETQCSCVPKYKKPYMEGNVIINQPSQPPAPDRKAVRLGSDCSFCFEFYKDVPPESPKGGISKPLNRFAAELQQNRNNFFSKFKCQHPSKIDECTCTEVISEVDSHDSNKQKQGETSMPQSSKDPKKKSKPNEESICDCENIKKKPVKPSKVSDSDRPLHMGSNVSFHFNFFRSISPRKQTHLAQADDVKTKQKCSCAALTDKGSGGQNRLTSECELGVCVDSKIYDTHKKISSPSIHNFPQKDIKKTKKSSKKECILELISKKNVKRLIIGDRKPKKEKLLVSEKQSNHSELSEVNRVSEYAGECEAKCKTEIEPERPLRVGSSFNFDYDIRNVTPKASHGKIYVEIPELNSSLKMNLFRVIMGKMRERVRPKRNVLDKPEITCDPQECAKRKRQNNEITCDPQECAKRKRQNNSWFSYILSNLRQQRQVNNEEPAKRFFADMLSETSDDTTQSDKCRNKRMCCKGKRKDDSLLSYILSNLKPEKKISRISEREAESFFSRMLAEDPDDLRPCYCKKSRKRKRKRRQPSYREYRDTRTLGEIESSIFSDSSRSRKSKEEKEPCRVSTGCCVQCDYDSSDESENDTQSSKSTDSRNYATT